MRVAFYNLGCKVNFYETEAMSQALAAEGYEIVPQDSEADVYIINTCSVTNIADRKSRQMLHRAKSSHPGAIVVAVGCYVQAAGEELLKDEAVDIIVGNDRKKDIPRILKEYMEKNDNNTYIYDLKQPRDYEELSIYEEKTHTRAYIKVQDGCNQFCSYCIIPYTRGRIRSRALSDVVEETKRLAETGICEVVITGIHLSSYGLDRLKAEGDYGGQTFAVNYLAELIEAVAGVDGIKRVRLSSLEPRIITEDFVKRLSTVPELCPHFHLSLQSGCDSVLKRMNRHYTTDEYERGLQILRKYFDRPALTTDVIVGFPGESEEEFEETYRYLEKINLFQLHVFKFSRRGGTVADKMPGQLTDAVKTKRSNRLLELTARQDKEYRKSLLGKKCEVLIEEPKEIGGEMYMTGHTREYIRVAVKGDESLAGQTLEVELCEALDEEINLAKPLHI